MSFFAISVLFLSFSCRHVLNAVLQSVHYILSTAKTTSASPHAYAFGYRWLQRAHLCICFVCQQDVCNEFADKYIEHDFVIIFIDMLLHKPQVYRHLLLNRISQTREGIEPNVQRFAILLILFEVCEFISAFSPFPSVFTLKKKKKK